MADERVRLVKRIGQTPVIEVKKVHMDELGPDGVAAGILALDIEPSELGAPVEHLDAWRIPVRRDD